MAGALLLLLPVLLPVLEDELDTEAEAEAEAAEVAETVAGGAALLLLLALELLPELEAVELALVLACGTWLVSIDSSAELVPEQGS